MRVPVLAGLMALALCGAARAAIVDQSAAGFEIRHTFTVKASADAVYAALLQDACPARTVVPVPELHHGYLVEVDAIAVRDP